MPPIPPEQSAELSASPPCGPHDRGTRPRTAGRGTDRSFSATTSPTRSAGPHQRHGDRGSGDDDASAARCVLPIFVRYADLVAAGIVANWTTLLRLIDTEGFPVGIMIGANTRAWRLDDIEAWLESRPSARKVMPPGATPPHRRKRADATADMTP